MPVNRFFDNAFNVPLFGAARSPTLRSLFEALEQACYDIQQELDGFTARGTRFESLTNVPASLSGSALKLLRVNTAASAIEFVAAGNVTIKEVAGTSYTLEPGDAGLVLETTNAAAVTVLVDANANQAFAAGDMVMLSQTGDGQVTFTAGTGVTINSSDGILRTRTNHAQVALLYRGDDSWRLIGERDLPAISFASLTGGNNFTGAQAVAPVALTDAASIATDASLGNTFYVTLGGNRTLANPTNLKHGGIYNWRVRQDGTGSRTLDYGSKFKWPGGTAPTLTTTASAIDFISGQYWSDTDTILCTSLKAFA